jgi:proline iminopeptidase
VATMPGTTVQDRDDTPPNPTRPRTPPRMLARLWQHRRSAIGVVVAAGAATGVTTALLLPRGPVVASQGVALMATGAVLGVLAGLVLRRRRAVLLVLLAHLAALELVRLPLTGPTVDGIHLGTLYGVVAFVTGRGFDALLLIPAAVVGAVYGAGLARHWSDGSPGRRWAITVRRVVAAVALAGLLAAVALVAQPARTDPILTADGRPLAGSIAELGTAHVGGHDTGLLLRGQNATAPVLLFLAGGPGGTELGATRLFGEALERDFVVATWDQRGAGTSYGGLDPTSTLTFQQAVDDTIELTEQLRTRFHQDRVYLMGNSYGTLLGVRAVQLRPDLYTAYIGSAQMVSPVATDRAFYDTTLAWATRTGDTGLVDTLRRNGPPPYTSVFPYEQALTYERDWNPYPRVPAYAAKGEMPASVGVPEYDLVQKVRALPSFLDTFAVLYPQLQGIDLRTQATQLEVPVYVVAGVHEAPGRAVPARQWFDALDAPSKTWVELPDAGHVPNFEQPARFADLMHTVLLAR